MSDRPYIRCIKGADTAILFVHGILGTPAHFDFLLPLVPKDWSVYNMLLGGHGGSVQDFSAASMTGWKQQVHAALQALSASHENIVIAAHSMGTLFAMQEAEKEQIAALFLLNTPLKIRPTPQLVKMMWKVFWGDIRPDNEWELAAQRACSISLDKYLWRYLGWVPRYLELFAEAEKTRPLAGKLARPAWVYLSGQDEMVSPQSGRFFEGNAQVSVKLLQTSGHFYYTPADKRQICRGFVQMIHQVSAMTDRRKKHDRTSRPLR